MAEAPTVFTLEAVNALVPRLRALVGDQIERRSDIEARLDRLTNLLGRSPETIQVDELDPPDIRELKRELVERIDSYRRGWREVEEMGAVLKDPRLGLVDFYGRVDGKLVWLCWKYGEAAVSHYHGLDEGFGGRRAIEPTMRLRHLN